MTAGTGVIDGAVERAGRWTAARTTRRSFVHRLGQLAVFVAAGPTIAGSQIQEAQASVCGHSDPNVRRIVESRGNDPRVPSVALTQLDWAGATGYHHAAIRAGHTSALKAVVADDQNRWMQYIAGPLAGTLGVPMLGISATGPTAEDIALLQDLGVTEVLTVGPVTGTDTFLAASIGVDVVTVSSNLATASQQVATRITTITDVSRTVTVETSGLSAEAAPAAAVLAALGGFPLMVGSVAAVAVGYPTLYIGPEPADLSPVSDRTTATGLVALSVELAELASALPVVSPNRIAIAPAGSSDVVGLVNLGVPVVLHPLDSLGLLETWIQDHSRYYGELQEIYYMSGPGALSTAEYWRTSDELMVR